jgi:hypothetical protein
MAWSYSYIVYSFCLMQFDGNTIEKTLQGKSLKNNNSIENVFLRRILNIAILQEEYEFCQMIFELMKERFHDQ